MKDCSKESLERDRPSLSALAAVNFCLDSLYNDKSKAIADEVADRCTYEELIGALLLARDMAMAEDED